MSPSKNTIMKPCRPQLLAPAGDLEKLYTAVTYGADAVYIGGDIGGLRQRAGNFSHGDMVRGISFAHGHGAKVYVAVNIYPRPEDIALLPPYLATLRALGVDAVIASDPAVVRCALEHGHTVHLSTQASCMNTPEALAWKETGVSRMVAARELSIEQVQRIGAASGLETEMFVHGSLCMSYSGKCLISNFTAGRDANRGGCVQSCRWGYRVCGEARDPGELVYPLNSQDIMGIRQLGRFRDAGISCLKIEGRMKSHLYIAATTCAYRNAIDDHDGTPETVDAMEELLRKISNRGFTAHFLAGRPEDPGINLRSSGYVSQVEYIGQIIGWQDGVALLYSRAPVRSGESLFLLNTDGELLELPGQMREMDDTMVKSVNPGTLVQVEVPVACQYWVVCKGTEPQRRPW